MSTTLIDLLRHGEPVGGRRYRGQVDDPLSEKGWAQMRAATTDRPAWSAVVSSPLVRCRAFAEELAGQMALPVEIDARLMEVGFGVWEGCTADQIQAEDPLAIANFKHDPVRCRPAGAEALEAFYARVAAAYDEVLLRHEGRHVLLVAHAGVIRMVLCRALGLTPGQAYHIQVGTAAMARIKVDRNAERRHDLLLHLTPGG